MRKQKKPAEKGNPGGQLRTAAEDKLARTPGVAPEMKEKTPEELVHQLRVHQIELEMQNEELKKAQRALEESRDRYVGLYDFAPVGYFTFTRGGRIADVNLTGAALLGVERRELLSRGFGHFVAPEDLERWERHLVSVYQSEQKQSCNLALKREDGATFHARLDSIRMEVSGGAPMVRTAVSDISERKRAEELLRESEEKYKTLFAGAREPIFIADAESGILLDCNEAACFLIERPKEELIGKNQSILHPPDELVGDFSDSFRRHITNEQGHVLNARVVTKSGVFKDVEIKANVLDIKGKKIIQGFFSDITERKRAEEELRQSKEFAANIISSSIDMIIAVNKERRITEFNKAAEESFGYKCEEVLGKHVNLLYADPEEGTKIHTKTVEQERCVHEVLNKRKNGELFTSMLSSSVLRDLHGELVGVMGISRDITERKLAELASKQAEEALRESERKLKEAQRLGRIGHWEFELGTQKIHWSDMIFTLYERDPKLGPPTVAEEAAYYSPEDAERLRNCAQRTIETGEPYMIDVRVKLPEGRSMDAVATGTPVKDAHGRVIRLLGTIQDITERKRAEEALAAERNLLRTLIDAIPDEIAVKDVDRRFLVVNPATVRALNRASADEVIGKKDEDLIPERFALQAREEEEGVLKTGRPFVNKLGRSKINPVTGEVERSILISKIPMKDREGKIIGVVGINRDITEVQRAAESLEKERTLLLTLIESIPDEICLKDTSHRYVVANSATVKALGARSLDDLVYKTDLDFVPAQMAQEHFAEEKAILESGKSMINRERIRRDTKTGEIEKCLLTTKVPVKDQNGKTIGILVINRYITERKRAEEAMRASEEKFRALFEESKDCTYISSADGRLLDINAAGVEMFGYGSKEELLRIDLGSDLYVDSQRREQFLSQMNQQGFVKDFEAILRRKDGGKLIVLNTATAVQNKQGKVVMLRGTIRDVTKQRQLERQVIQAQKMESLGLLAGGIAHDFNNVLGIILGHTAMIERAGQEPALLKSSTEEITKAVQRGASLVRQILTFARKSDATLEPVNVNAIIRELSKMIGDTFPKTIAVSLDLEKSIPIIMMDQTQLHQALLNLCVNARDAITDPSTGKLGRGELKIKTRVVEGGEVRKKFSEASPAEYICISVSDSGMGMDDVTKQHIFEPFFTTKEMGKGTGLGLSVVYGIIKAHRGHIELESEVGSGTTFRAYLPVTEGKAAPVAQVETGSVGVRGGKETILLVEDEENLLALMKSMLERAGYTVLTATDGIGAIKVFSLNKEKIALVLTDIGLPKLDGTAVFTSLREIDPNVRIILASGYLEPNLKSNLLRAGAKEFIQKPYSPGVVLKRIREVLDESS